MVCKWLSRKVPPPTRASEQVREEDLARVFFEASLARSRELGHDQQASWDDKSTAADHGRECFRAGVRAILSRLSLQEREKDAWQPIETAPKDGTRILGYIPEDVFNGPAYAVIYWYVHEGEHFEDAGNSLYRKQTMKTEWWEGAGFTPFRATHWMPLPAAPAAQGQG